MTAIPYRQKQRAIVALCCGIAAALMLPAGLVVGYNSVLNSGSGTNVNDVRTLKILSTPVALLATVNTSQEITSISVIALSGSSPGGTIISLPARSMAEVRAGEEPRRVSDSYSGGDAAAFVADVEGLLDVSFSAVAILGRADTASLIDSIGPSEILLDTDVRNTEPDGALRTVAKLGRTTVETSTLVDILLARQTDQAEADRFNHQKSVLTAIANTVGLGLGPRSTTNDTSVEDLTDITAFFQRLIAGPVQVWQFAATAVTNSELNPFGVDMYQLDVAEVTMIMASVAPTSITGTGVAGQLSVQIDSPFNNAVVSREIVRRLLAKGLNVALVREVPGPPPDVTQVLYVDQNVLGGVEDLVSYIGEVTAARTSERAQGIDVQIVIGATFAVFLEGNPPIPTTTVVAGDE
ncbi:MAG: LCP family protein [Ilumatobacteraceae bacterium]|nr:LCP family protein [Ilumatobacteraceae bacterium]